MLSPRFRRMFETDSEENVLIDPNLQFNPPSCLHMILAPSYSSFIAYGDCYHCHSISPSYSSFIAYGDCLHCHSISVFYIILGLALSLFGSVMWPCIPLVVAEDMVGSAFGITTAIQNVGLGLAPLLFEELIAHSGSFNSTFAFILVSTFFALIASIMLMREDTRTGGKLHKP